MVYILFKTLYSAKGCIRCTSTPQKNLNRAEPIIEGVGFRFSGIKYLLYIPIPYKNAKNNGLAKISESTFTTILPSQISNYHFQSAIYHYPLQDNIYHPYYLRHSQNRNIPYQEHRQYYLLLHRLCHPY